jgi:hypothetical protein
MRLAKDTFHSDVCPSIAELLTLWQTPIQGEVGLKPLTARLVAAPAPAAPKA